MRKVAVAVSGGRDSTALLHCTVKAAAALGVQVVALHVHHGLNPHAEDWLLHVQKQSRRWGAGFASSRLLSQPATNESVEAWARRERYAALAQMAAAQGCHRVLLAHHRRDQAETWLLQALRGAGAAGLSAMPLHMQKLGVLWDRPWLNHPSQAIDAYVRKHRLKHIEDSSNSDPRFARNRLRSQVWPALTAAFADAEQSLVAAATRAQEGAALAAEIALLDMRQLALASGLHMPAWLALSPARRLNVLRAWLGLVLPRGAPQTLVERLMFELPACDMGHWLVPGMHLRLYRGVLRTVAAPAPSDPSALAGKAAGAVIAPKRISLAKAGLHAVPDWQGHFVSTRAVQGGIAASLLKGAQLRQREGGEQFRFGAKGTARSLKKQFQARAVPAWQRQGPLLFSAQGQLLFVPGLGVDAAALALAGQAQWQLHWQPDAGAGTDKDAQIGGAQDAGLHAAGAPPTRLKAPQMKAERQRGR
jgi:tRNA(Ile)-lysidine synthase